MFLSLPVCMQDNPKIRERILVKFLIEVGYGQQRRWLNFDGDPGSLLDFGSFRIPFLSIGREIG